jgi:phosphoenolpyruvate carboxykinase (diphosphate)
METTNAVSEALRNGADAAEERDLIRYINLKLAALGESTSNAASDAAFMQLAGPLLRNHFEKDELLGWPLCPVDARIQKFLEAYLADAGAGAVRLPSRTLVLDRPAMGRVLSLPPKRDRFTSPYVTSYRVAQGVLHNPKSDRRTTKGVFHVAEGGLPIPDDKQAVTKRAFARLLAAALRPPEDAMTLPFTADEPVGARLFVSLLLRPLVCPRTERDPEKRMEVRFFAPGSLVSNLDFVESIFGNGGDPFLLENDAALDVAGWTGHTGCVILAPHLVGLTKVELGLPHIDEATPRQVRDGMCYRDPDELYNGGNAFKVTCRDERGVIVTVIADNYYGYCKKEVKTQISYAANLYGSCEEEHSGGVLAYPSYILGSNFSKGHGFELKRTTFEQALGLLGDRVDVKPGRHAVDRRFQSVHYVPEDAEFDLPSGVVHWIAEGARQELPLHADEIYVLPSGYKVRVEKQRGGTAWRLVGSRGEGVLCHKPCTVSGGGKSEISKSLQPMIQASPVYLKDYERDFERVAQILALDFSKVYKPGKGDARAARPIMSSERSLGSVVKLLTPSDDYTDEHNDWLRALPQTIRALVFVVKRYHQAEWGDPKSHLSVDTVNGFPSHELKLDGQLLLGGHLRVGFEPATSLWRMFRLRPDFHPADKVQVEDDITASTIVARSAVSGLAPAYPNASVKIVANCEEYLFQRPDDAVHRGFDAQAETDLATPGTFISNFEPLARGDVQRLADHVMEFDRFTPPMRDFLSRFLAAPNTAYAVSSAHLRLVDGKPSKNPRYLQRRPDRVNERDTYVAEIGARLDSGVTSGQALLPVVHAVLGGRRANKAQPEIGLPPLAVFGPLHYQELPELCMDFLSSLTGKSPSTTGFGSEGALTKGPFNALWPVVDMNNALVSAILTGYAGFTSVAGYIGPRYKVDHDVSMLVPELWCRMSVQERDPAYLIEHGYLERIADFDHEGRRVLGSRLGFRITRRFVEHFLGRMFQTPNAVFTEDMLRPELQGLEPFVAGVDALVATQTRVAKSYFDDGSVNGACPPLRALLHVMVHGHYEGMSASDLRFRELFTRESLLASEWYRERLLTKQRRDIALWRRHEAALDEASNLRRQRPRLFCERLEVVEQELARVSSGDYLVELTGTLGADPFAHQEHAGQRYASAAE